MTVVGALAWAAPLRRSAPALATAAAPAPARPSRRRRERGAAGGAGRRMGPKPPVRVMVMPCIWPVGVMTPLGWPSDHDRWLYAPVVVIAPAASITLPAIT